jgi:hypothetical protein
MQGAHAAIRWTEAIACRWEITSTLLLLQVARPSEPSDVLPHVHAYLADRYLLLATYHRERGRAARADRAVSKARQHWTLSNPTDPPPAAAVRQAMPELWLTEARGRVVVDEDAA